MILEKDNLELVITEKSLGSLVTNADHIRELVKAMLPKYSKENYDFTNIAQAKTDKALLNNSAKVLNAKRIELEKEFLKPFAEFKDVITDTISLIADTTRKIDDVVKESEILEKEAKRKTIGAFWDKQGFTLVTLEKIFDDRWLNKSLSMKKVQEEIKAKTAGIEQDLMVLKNTFPEDYLQVQSLYLDKLNLSAALKHANTLAENRQKIKAAEAAKAAPVEPTPAPEEVAPAPKVAPVSRAVTPLFTAPSFSAPAPAVAVPAEQPKEGVLTRVMLVRGTKDQIIELGNWMYANNIYFEKYQNQ